MKKILNRNSWSKNETLRQKSKIKTMYEVIEQIQLRGFGRAKTTWEKRVTRRIRKKQRQTKKGIARGDKISREEARKRYGRSKVVCARQRKAEKFMDGTTKVTNASTFTCKDTFKESLKK